MLIRPRRDSDIGACAGLVREVHARERYPRMLPGDVRSFLDLPGAYGCWVADHGGQVAGHVALLPRGVAAALEVASTALGRPAGQLAVVARLFVSPQARGQGAGRLLLGAAAGEAAARGLWPVLDVDTGLAAAISLYQNCGWVRAGTVTVPLGDGTDLREYVYLGPPPAGADAG